MQITINLPPDLEQHLIRQAAQSNIQLQTLILQTLRQTIQPKFGSISQWSEAIMSYEGIPDFPLLSLTDRIVVSDRHLDFLSLSSPRD